MKRRPRIGRLAAARGAGQAHGQWGEGGKGDACVSSRCASARMPPPSTHPHGPVKIHVAVRQAQERRRSGSRSSQRTSPTPTHGFPPLPIAPYRRVTTAGLSRDERRGHQAEGRASAAMPRYDLGDYTPRRLQCTDVSNIHHLGHHAGVRRRGRRRRTPRHTASTRPAVRSMEPPSLPLFRSAQVGPAAPLGTYRRVQVK